MATLTLSNNVIAPNSLVPLNVAQGPLELTWPANPSKLYTVIMTDPDAPSPQNPVNAPVLHYLVSNIPGNQIQYGDVLMPYTSPNPPIGSHRYRVDIYEQTHRYNAPPVKERTKFPLDTFVQQYGLRLYSRIVFLTSKEGGYQMDPPITDPATNPATDEDQRNYCNCRRDVAEREPLACLEEKAWYERREGYKCSNPYAVCGRLPHISTECSSYYDYDTMTDKALKSLAILDKKEIPSPYDRQELIHRLKYGKR